MEYNGRLCMVSAAGANKLAFGIDRAGNRFSDILQTDCLLIAGSTVGECFPVMTQYVWGARDRGAKLIVVDPRETAIACTAVHVALRSGTDAAFFNTVLNVVIQDGLADEAFVAAHTTGSTNTAPPRDPDPVAQEEARHQPGMEAGAVTGDVRALPGHQLALAPAGVPRSRADRDSVVTISEILLSSRTVFDVRQAPLAQLVRAADS